MNNIYKYIFATIALIGLVNLITPYVLASERTQENRVDSLIRQQSYNFRFSFDKSDSTLIELKKLEPFFTKKQKDLVYLMHAAVLGFQGKHTERTALVNGYLTQVTDADMRARFLDQLIGAYSNLGEYEKAILSMNEATALLPALRTREGISATLQGAVNLLRTLKEYDEALVYANRMLELKPNPDRPSERCLGILNTVELNYIRGDVQHARSLIPESDATCKVGGNRLYVQILQAMSVIDLINSGNYQKGINQGVPLAADFENLNHRNEYRMRLEEALAKAFMSSNDLKSASKFGLLAFDHAKEAKAVEQVESAAETMAKVHERQGDNPNALAFLKIAFEYRKKRTDDDLLKNLAYQRVKFNLREKAMQLSALENKNQVLRIEQELEKKNTQTIFWVAVFSATVMIILLVMLIFFIKQRKKYLRLVQIDQLTNIFDRTFFISRASEKIAGRLAPISIVLLNLDRFRKINAAYGFSMGDHILVEVCSKIKTLLTVDDLFGRMQGDEFAICMVGPTEELARHLAEKCRLAILELNIDKLTPDHKLTASIGVATIDTKGLTNFEDTLNAARDSLLLSKSLGGNCVNG